MGLERRNNSSQVKYKFRIKFWDSVFDAKTLGTIRTFFSSCPLVKDLNSLLRESFQETPKDMWSFKTIAYHDFPSTLICAELNSNSLTETVNTPNSSWSQTSAPGKPFYTAALDLYLHIRKEVHILHQTSEGFKKGSWFYPIQPLLITYGRKWLCKLFDRVDSKHP